MRLSGSRVGRTEEHLLASSIFIVFISTLERFRRRNCARLTPTRLCLSTGSFIRSILRLPSVVRKVTSRVSSVLSRTSGRSRTVLVFVITTTVFRTINGGCGTAITNSLCESFSTSTIVGIVFRH